MLASTVRSAAAVFSCVLIIMSVDLASSVLCRARTAKW